MVIKVELSVQQKIVYKGIQDNNMLMADPNNKNSKATSLKNAIMQLRKICNHPYLFEGHEPIGHEISDHIFSVSGKFELLDRMLPKLIIKDDLRPEVTQDQGYSMVASNMVSFIAKIRGDKDVAEKALKGFKNEGEEFFAPFIEAMKLEGSYNMKIPCYNWNLTNPQSGLECMSGSPWVTQSQVRMGGDTSDVNVTLDTYDNFHRVYTTKPHHIP